MIISDGVPGHEDHKFIHDITESLDEWVASMTDLTPSQKNLILANDRQALFAISDWLSEEISSMIDDIDEIINHINAPCLLLMSNLEKYTVEHKLMKKCADVIPNAKFSKSQF